VAAEPAARETIPHVKRWEGEPVPSVQVADEWRARAKAGNFSEVKNTPGVLCWRCDLLPSQQQGVL
jgi:hypothetical protein